MSTNRLSLLPLVCVGVVVFFSGGRAMADPASVPSGCSSYPDLQWMPDGEGIIVDHRWLVHHRTGTWTPLMPPHAQDTTSVYRAPSGEIMVALEAHQIRFRVMGGAWEAPEALPQLLPRVDESNRQAPLIVMLSDTLVYLAQQALIQDDQGGATFLYECRLYDRSKKTWSTLPKGCINGDFASIFAIESGPRGLIAIHSVGEGHPGISIQYFDPVSGQREAGFKAPNLYPHGPLHVQFGADDERILVTSPCNFTAAEADAPCANAEEQAPWRLYTWRKTAPSMILIREKLPPDSSVDPTGEMIAWPEACTICVRKIDGADPKRCFPLPPSSATVPRK